jgi:hypothetical protein
MRKKKQISLDDARRIGESLYIDVDQIDLEQYRQGLMGNHTQAAADPEMGPVLDGLLLSGRLVLEHMQEFPDYFTRLEKLRSEAGRTGRTEAPE